jgi:hypothetical protein
MAPSPRSGDELLGNAMRSPGNSTTDARLRAEQHPTYKMGTLSKLVGFFYVDEHVPELTWTIQMDADMICRRSDAPFDTVSGVTYRLDDLGWIWMCTPDKQPERRLVTYSDGALEWDNRRTSRRLATCACLFGCGHQSETLHDLLRVHALYCAKRRVECVLGCGTLMPMARVDEHERLCVRRWMTCSLGCGIRLAMRDVDAHTRACSHRTGACRLGCGLHLRACDAPRHESECTYRSAPR